MAIDQLPASAIRAIMQRRLAADLAAYMLQKGFSLAYGAGEINILYIEGADEDGRPNADRVDEWNDRCIVMEFNDRGDPRILLNVVCTTEPGYGPTLSAAAKRRKGVARIEFGQYTAWALGWHKKASHPALVQVRNVTVCRDLNKDFKRTGDRRDTGLFGINQHSTAPDFNRKHVGGQSEGCLVRRNWIDHLAFIALCREDVRYRRDAKFIFTSTIIDGDAFGRFVDGRRKAVA